MFNILRGHYRWVIIDLSHWLDELFLQIVQDADLALMLVELSVPDLRNLGHLWPLLRNWIPVQEKVQLVINRYDRTSGLSLGNLVQVLKQKAYFTLPSDYQNRQRSHQPGRASGRHGRQIQAVDGFGGVGPATYRATATRGRSAGNEVPPPPVLGCVRS